MNDSSAATRPKDGAVNPAISPPAVSFETITFSDRTTITLGETDVVVFVGPNNAGKSLALRELEEHFGNHAELKAIKSTELRRTGTWEDLSAYLQEYAQMRLSDGNRIYSGYRYSLAEQRIANYWTKNLSRLREFFCMRILTETRINDSDAAPAISILEESASHPIHMLYSDDQLEYKISDYFRRAFGEDLIVFRAGGNQFPLLVGNRLNPRTGEDRISRSYLERLQSEAKPLNEQGDGMRSFASVILHLLAPITPSILLLDEPEAFLHPPQARLLGEIIAAEKSTRAQLFVATHSSDVLQGLINVAPDHLRVLRIQRDGNVNHIKELDKNLVKAISTDPLMKYSSVMSGLFHERVVICEADGDCMFYSSLLDLPQISGQRHPDVLFVHAGGKSRMASLAKALRELDVPVDIIADIDILRDDGDLRKVCEALGGHWPQLQPLARSVRVAIEQHKPWLNSGEIKQAIEEIIEEAPPTGEFPRTMRSNVESVFRKLSPWDSVKSAGEAALPPGQPTQDYRKLQQSCAGIGLWLVPVGELEGFCRSIGGDGPKWVQQVIEQKNLADDPELDSARRFVQEIWTSRSGKIEA